MRKPRVLLLDLETAPILAHVWAFYDQNISSAQVERYSRILTWAAKWLDSPVYHYDAQYLHKKAYKADPDSDYEVCDTLWDLVDEADIIIAHNGNAFDCKVMNARFIANGMKPPSPYRQIDTLLIARRVFKFASNKLDDLGIQLGLGRKVDTGGFKLWKDIVTDHCPLAWAKMVTYNIGDVKLLEDVYLKLRPFDKRHPNMDIFSVGAPKCVSCGSDRIYKRGQSIQESGTYQRWSCKDCGKHMVGARIDKATKTLKGA